MDLDRLIEALRKPSAYPHEVDEVEVLQTHISVVFLAGECAYKIKKPVELDFLDYGTLDKRLHYCEQEVRLNRRLAPDVYLGVSGIVRDGSSLCFADEPSKREAVIEWAVRMRRLPEERTLQHLVDAEAIEPIQIERLARHLADFHAGAERGPDIARYGRFDVVAKNARDNFGQSRQQRGVTVHASVFDRLAELTDAAFERRRDLIAARAAMGVPCNTHGDLRLDHVYFPESDGPPVIVDCIEFNPAFRFADPVADMAFLAMDLRHAGRRDLAALFAGAYFGASGDEQGTQLLDFYMAYRAAVRGKVQGIKAAAPEVDERDRRRAARTARSHWLLALGILAPPAERPALVLVGGLPGTGKSTLSRHLAGKAGFEVVRTDAVRKELAGLEQTDSGGNGYGEGIYTPGWTEKTYRACQEQAEEMLFKGGRVIVDASFHDEKRRREFLQLGLENGAAVLFLVCKAEAPTVRARLAKRRGDVSDADWAIYRQMADRWERPSTATRRITASVSTGGSVEASVTRAMDVLQASGLL